MRDGATAQGTGTIHGYLQRDVARAANVTRDPHAHIDRTECPPVPMTKDFKRSDNPGGERNLFIPADQVMSNVRVYAVNAMIRYVEDRLHRLIAERETMMQQARDGSSIGPYDSRKEIEDLIRRRVKDTFRDWLKLHSSTKETSMRLQTNPNWRVFIDETNTRYLEPDNMLLVLQKLCRPKIHSKRTNLSSEMKRRAQQRYDHMASLITRAANFVPEEPSSEEPGSAVPAEVNNNEAQAVSPQEDDISTNDSVNREEATPQNVSGEDAPDWTHQLVPAASYGRLQEEVSMLNQMEHVNNQRERRNNIDRDELCIWKERSETLHNQFDEAMAVIDKCIDGMENNNHRIKNSQTLEPEQKKRLVDLSTDLVCKNLQQPKKKQKVATAPAGIVLHPQPPLVTQLPTVQPLSVTDILKTKFGMDATTASDLSKYGPNRDNANERSQGYGAHICSLYKSKYNNAAPRKQNNVNVYIPRDITWIVTELSTKLQQDAVPVDLTR